MAGQTDDVSLLPGLTKAIGAARVKESFRL
jgi:hypothetical protein